VLALAAMLCAQEPAEYTRAVGLVKQQRWQEAKDPVDRLLATYPDNPKVLNLAALLRAGTGDIAGAEAGFRAALRLHPDFAPAWKNLAILEWSHQLPSRAADTDRALEVSPRDPLLNAYGALTALENGRRDLATQRLGLAGNSLSLLPPALEARLGSLLGSRGFYAEAERVFSDLSTHGHNTSAVQFNLALAQMLQGRSEAAIATLTGHSPLGSDALNLLAQAYEKENQPQRAVDTLRKAIAADPGIENNYLDLANLCVDHGLDPQAEKVVDAGLARMPRSSKLLFEAGLLRSLAGKAEEANSFFNRALLLDPHRDLPAAAIELLQMEQSKIPEAISGLRDKLRNDPDSALLWYFLGVALNRAGNQEDGSHAAEEAFRKATSLDPKLPFPNVELAKIYAHSGRIEEAIPLLQRALEFPSTKRPATYQLAMAYRKLNQPDKAREMLSKLSDQDKRFQTDPRNDEHP
jgi:predicted Zn-dependent protease